VIVRRHLRQPRKSRALPRLFLFNIPTCKPSDIPIFWFSVSSSKFRIPQLLYLPLLRKHRGVWGYSSHFGKSARSRRQELTFPFKFFLFTLFQTLLHSRKTQLVSFQAIPNSFTKTPGGGGTSGLPTCNHSNSQAMFSAPVDRRAKAGDNFMSTSSTEIAAISEEGE
jgi:hypothetical protein